jgi:hypothetical protein
MTPTRFISSRVVLSAVWIASAGLAINMVLLATHGAAESPTPYVVVLKEISTGPKGIQPGSTQLFAVKANGSNMTSTDYFTTNRPASQRWIYLASGKRIETDELTGLGDVPPAVEIQRRLG